MDSNLDDTISDSSQESDDDFDSYYEEGEGEEEEEEKFPAIVLPDWKEIESSQKPAWISDYTIQAGPRYLQLNQTNKPYDFFNLMFPDCLFQNIMNWTNKKASKDIDNRQRAKNKMKKWYPMDKKEMKAFVGILYVMGIIKLPNIILYWEKDSTLFSFAGISVLFSRKRFSDIYTHLCLRDPNTKPENSKDRLFKINAFVNTIIEQSQKYYLPECEIVIDESMIPFHGRNKLVQFMPLKPIRYGFKAFLLCEAKTGYVLGWKLFTGDPRDVDEDFGLTYKIVRTLCADLTGNNNILYTDRFCTGLQIYTDLKYLGIGACGTIQANRAQLSEEVSSRIKQLTPNEIVYFKSKQGLLLSCWKDSSVVMMLSNCYESGTAETTRRRKRKEIEKLERERELENASEEDPDVPDIEVKVKLNIPISIYDYNKNMSGVDLFDQKAAYYGVLLRSH